MKLFQRKQKFGQINSANTGRQRKNSPKSIVVSIAAFVIAFALTGAIFRHFRNIDPQAKRNTERNSFISGCKDEAASSYGKVFTPTQAENYCTCAENALYDKYGDKLYTADMLSQVRSSGFSQADTDLLVKNCKYTLKS